MRKLKQFEDEVHQEIGMLITNRFLRDLRANAFAEDQIFFYKRIKLVFGEFTFLDAEYIIMGWFNEET